ncbi:snRNA-activating protein of 50kDa MW C terminal-domain-containing protein [Lentinula raphanica]|uniref:snRNA-activating protein of 50kDa MW C terminal-domain-containing protein n=1 Tax=Lentinula raphanica TaxID=153919 RepID=A0AA38PKH4_9AGAR|nr:snRNA-activating protein of 50kDa MW C terminal-domain-containing protein [Lentinula raphanica]KAJ3829938.1 snRNA-activating protein of 50kDa MW C terminal-domain-containing protein [Lentinula raphanica]KAJ3844612.1 snRNA-activating protein of 50kDa MW C terminal-domain-containing protein [Lentinula raphanica]KAJ3973698.1 snRNA-activating protein of 50kDa MW C terminal-domain-containing protein [Lentinula raphanica]
MNQRIEYVLASEFGPSSETVDVMKFSQEANAISHSVQSSPGPEVDQASIAAECSVADIQNSLMDVWQNPMLSAYLYRSSDVAIASLHGSTSKLAKTRKRSAASSESQNELQEVRELQSKLDAIPLSSWKLQPDAVLFTRPPRNADYNTLTAVKTSDTDMDAPSAGIDSHVLITFTTHFKVQWRSSVLSKCSQHVMMASQTLGDLFEVMPCVSNELPEEVLEDGKVVSYKETNGMHGSSGCVIVVNDVAYGDGLNEEDYADKLIQHLKITKSTTTIKKSRTSMHDTPLSSLALQVNKPYWLLHQGNCEHYIVIDQIRLKHSKDPATGYPLTLYQAPASLDFCQACTKIPAVWSVVGDVRLEASPCLLCDSCWRSMGDPTDESEEVLVLPLPKYKLW